MICCTDHPTHQTTHQPTTETNTPMTDNHTEHECKKCLTCEMKRRPGTSHATKKENSRKNVTDSPDKNEYDAEITRKNSLKHYHSVSLNRHVCVGVRACLHACVCACVRACVRARARARVRACVCVLGRPTLLNAETKTYKKEE